MRTVVLSLDQFMVAWTRILWMFHSGSVATLLRMNAVGTEEDREYSPKCAEIISPKSSSQSTRLKSKHIVKNNEPSLICHGSK